MNIFVLFLPAAIFLLILYFALSKKSTSPVKKAALITLGILILSVIISLFLIFSEPGGAVPGTIESVPNAPVKPNNANIPALIVFIFFFLFFLGIIIFVLLRERRETTKQEEILRLSNKAV
jgi:cbb3-type cytochrome oxidase subunit 3